MAAWLDEEPGAKTPQKILGNADLQNQVKMQDAAAEVLRERRHEGGALTFHTADLQPVLTSKVSLSILQERLHNRASRLTEDFMIAVNQATAGFLDQRGGRAEQQKPNGLEPEDNGVAPAE